MDGFKIRYCNCTIRKSLFKIVNFVNIYAIFPVIWMDGFKIRYCNCTFQNCELCKDTCNIPRYPDGWIKNPVLQLYYQKESFQNCELCKHTFNIPSYLDEFKIRYCNCTVRNSLFKIVNFVNIYAIFPVIWMDGFKIRYCNCTFQNCELCKDTCNIPSYLDGFKIWYCSCTFRIYECCKDTFNIPSYLDEFKIRYCNCTNRKSPF